MGWPELISGLEDGKSAIIMMMHEGHSTILQLSFSPSQRVPRSRLTLGPLP